MKKLIRIGTIAASVSLAACDSSDSVKWHGGENIKTMESIDFSASEDAANEALNKFSFEAFNATARYYKETSSDTISGNIAFSPLSMSLCMSLRALSYDDATEKSTLNAMGINSLRDLSSVCNKLMRFLPSKACGGKTILANSIWYNDLYSPSASYIKQINKQMFCDVVGFDSNNMNGLQNTIDGWAFENTNGLISSFPVNTSPDLVTVILNAMYYSGDWILPFDPNDTEVADFNGTAGVGKCHLMHQKLSEHSFYPNDSFDATMLNFSGDNRMWVILPKEDVEIEQFSQDFDFVTWKSMQSKVTLANINLYFPKLEQSTNIKLNYILESFGINLSNLVPQKMGINTTTYSTISQVTKVEIDEYGAKIAAVTGDGEIGASPFHIDNVELRFDRPFLYFIENYTTGAILMAGRVCNL